MTDENGTGPEREWIRLPVDTEAPVGTVQRVVASERAICVTRTTEGWGVLDDRCPHQGGPLGDGILEGGYVICPWHGYEYDPVTGQPPEGFSDAATSYAVRIADDGVMVELPVARHEPKLMEQVVDTLCHWGLDTVFGMVGHSNLGMAEALRRAADAGRIRYIGIRHEGAAAFAASAYGKLTGRPAACFSIAGPGATNLLTGLWDAKVDRAPVLALTGQVNTQVLGPGAFQELPLAEAFSAVSEWSQTIIQAGNATELAALAMKHAEVQRDVAHLILPDEVQELPAPEDPPARPKQGRVAAPQIAPPPDELARAVEMIEGADRPVIIVGNGARPFRREVAALAEHIDAPVITTFKAKGTIADDHPLAGSVLGRSGTPVGSALMAKADVLLVLGASFSNHTGIATWVPTIQVDFDRMALGKFHPVEVPLWGEIGRTLGAMAADLTPRDRPELRAEIARRWSAWRKTKSDRAAIVEADGRLHPAAVFAELSEVAPDDAVIAVDVGNNTYAFGHYFECRGRQDVLMSGYLGSIGFGLPAAMGAWAAVQADGSGRKIMSISGDGGLGQYLAEVTTAAKYGMGITHVVLNNDELGKISREQVAAIRPVWQTSLRNPDFAAYAESCGAAGFRVTELDELRPTLDAAFGITDRPSLVEVRTSARSV